jgi:tRNA A-37 threonylcarbamoyl transferase component Bud32
MTQGSFTSGTLLAEGYVVDRLLGAGAHGTVVAVTRSRDGARLALKILDPRAGDERRLEREARVLARLDHPAIVRVHDTGRLSDGRLYVALERLEGPTLGAAIARRGPLEPAEAVGILRDVAGALACAHEAGVVHRDLHPGNVMLVGEAPRGRAKVLDFGMAAFAEDARLTPSGAAPGTVAYMAPEQLSGAATPQSDLYAWGLVLLECLIGRRVVTGRSFYEVAFKQLRDDAVPIPPALLAHPLGALLARTLAKSAAARPSTAAELVDALAAIDVSDLVVDPTPSVVRRVEPTPPSSAPLSPLGAGRERRQVTVVAVEPGELGPAELAAWARGALAGLGAEVGFDASGAPVALFGVPVAREDDAARAAHAVLGLSASGVPRAGAPRAGIASGVVVVDARASGEALAVARDGVHGARARALAVAAPPGAVLVDDATAHLVRARFACDAGAYTDARGASVNAHRVVRAHAVPPRGLAGPLVGRDRELGLLHRAWNEARAGACRAVVLVGEAGIGKSRLLEALGESVRAEGSAWIDCACSPHAANTPLFPLLQRARERAGITFSDDVVTARRKLVDAGIARAFGSEGELDLVASLLVDGVRDATSVERRVAALASLVASPTPAPPVLLSIEDAGWCDPTTLALLGAALQRPGARLLVVLTARAELALPGALAHADEVALGRQPADMVAAIVRASSPATLEDTDLDHIVEAADGVPLFAVELARSLATQGPGGRATAIPTTVRGVLAERLDALGEAKRTAQLAALCGREVRHEVLAAVAPWGEAGVSQDLAAMLQLGIVFQRGVPPAASYQFVHHLARDVAHDSMLPDVRAAWHGALGDVVVARFAGVAEAEPESMAVHFAEAGRPLDAARWAERAGRLAFSRSGPVEALRHFRFALRALDAVAPSSERDDVELALQRGVEFAAGATEGMASPAVEAALRRVRAIEAAKGDDPAVFLSDRLLATQDAIRARFGRALADADRALDAARRLGSPEAEAVALMQRGLGLFAGARFVEAEADLARSVGLFERAAPSAAPSGVDPRRLAACFRARATWHLGAVDRALALQERDVAEAARLGVPHGELVARNGLMQIHLMRRDGLATEVALDELVTCAGSSVPPSLAAFVDLTRAWVAAQRGEDRLATALDAVDRFLLSGMRIDATLLCALTADACLAVGRIADGLHLVERGLGFVAEHGELHSEPELHRLRGLLLAVEAGPASDEAREPLELAASLASVAGARSLALRIACDLARWHVAAGDRVEARAVLEPELALVTEGDGTIDVVDARALGALVAAR